MSSPRWWPGRGRSEVGIDSSLFPAWLFWLPGLKAAVSGKSGRCSLSSACFLSVLLDAVNFGFYGFYWTLIIHRHLWFPAGRYGGDHEDHSLTGP